MGVTAREPSPCACRSRVLVAIDEPQLLRALRIVLRNPGFAVEVARTALDARALLAEHPPDVLVFDLVLPDGAGVEVCREVRRFSQLPIVIMSALGEEREIGYRLCQPHEVST
jgi:two-component system KDP operon response regulator KdpE